MKLSFLQKLGGPTVQKAALKVSKYAPEILTGVGIAGVIGSTILIARATLKVEPIIDRHEQKIASLKDDKQAIKDMELVGTNPGFTEKEVSREMVKVYALTSLDLLKIYGPGISLSAGSIVSILIAHGIMKRRAVVLMGTVKALESAFQAYRNRVVEEYGTDVDRDFRLGFKTETSTDPETGKKTKTRVLDPNHYSMYARFFDEGNSNWRGDIPEYNLMFLKNMQQWATDKLRVRGFLFLSDVYDMLGFDQTPQSRLVGWVMDPENGGDLHVDFGIYTADAVKARDFVNGLETSVLLDFNVDGTIIDLI